MNAENPITTSPPGTPNTPLLSKRFGFTHIFIIWLTLLNVVIIGVAAYDRHALALALAFLIGPALNIMSIFGGVIGFRRSNPPSARATTDSQFLLALGAPIALIPIDFLIIMLMDIQIM